MRDGEDHENVLSNSKDNGEREGDFREGRIHCSFKAICGVNALGLIPFHRVLVFGPGVGMKSVSIGETKSPACFLANNFPRSKDRLARFHLRYTSLDLSFPFGA